MDTKKDVRQIFKIIYITVIAVVVTSLGLFAAYHYFIILAPNFEDVALNYVKALSSEEIKPGDDIELELSYFNHGYRDVRDLHVEFFIPQNTKAVKDGTPAMHPVEDRLVLDRPLLKRNEGEKVQIALITDSPLDNETEIKIAKAVMTYEVGNDLKTAALGEEMSFKITSSPKMTLSRIIQRDKNGGDLRIGDNLNISFKTSNKGDMNAGEVTVEAAVPKKAEIIKSSIYPKDFEINDSKIIWEIDNYKTNTETAFSYDIKILEGVKKDEILVNDVKLKTRQGDSLSAAAEATVKLFPELNNSKVVLSDKNGEYLWAGDVINSTISIENSGDVQAEDVILICPVPKNTTYVSGSAKCAGAEIVDASGKEIVFKIKKVDIGEKRVASLDFQVSSGMTGGGTVKTAFVLSAEERNFDIKQAEINVKANFKVAIVCLGDSLIVRSNWPQILGSMLNATFPRTDYSIIASGISQETASGGFHRFDSTVAGYNPHIVIIGYGTNDTGGGADKFRYYLNGLVEKAKSINATVLLESLGYINTSMEPSKTSWPDYQRIIYNAGASNGVPVADIYTPLSRDPQRYVADWVHYTPEGSAVVAQTVFNYIVQYLDGYGVRK